MKELFSKHVEVFLVLNLRRLFISDQTIERRLWNYSALR